MLAEKILEDLKQAQLSRDELKVSTLRLLLSEIKNAQIAQRTIPGQETELTDEEIFKVIQKEVKRRQDATAGFRGGGREEQARREEAEEEILRGYLPRPLSNEELTKLVEGTIKDIGAKSLQDMGRVTLEVLRKTGSRAEGGRVSTLVREKLSKAV